MASIFFFFFSPFELNGSLLSAEVDMLTTIDAGLRAPRCHWRNHDRIRFIDAYIVCFVFFFWFLLCRSCQYNDAHKTALHSTTNSIKSNKLYSFDFYSRSAPPSCRAVLCIIDPRETIKRVPGHLLHNNIPVLSFLMAPATRCQNSIWASSPIITSWRKKKISLMYSILWSYHISSVFSCSSLRLMYYLIVPILLPE